MNFRVTEIQPLKLKERLERGEDIFLVDVREDWEHSFTLKPVPKFFLKNRSGFP